MPQADCLQQRAPWRGLVNALDGKFIPPGPGAATRFGTLTCSRPARTCTPSTPSPSPPRPRSTRASSSSTGCWRACRSRTASTQSRSRSLCGAPTISRPTARAWHRCSLSSGPGPCRTAWDGSTGWSSSRSRSLGRPRIDVVCNCSGVFRDLFINQMNLLDRAIKLAAEADEPVEQNFVRKHSLEQAKELNISLRQAATRVFSNAAGSYSANVGIAIENGGNIDEDLQLQEQFLTRKGFALSSDAPGELTESTDLFKSALSKVDVTFQNLDSSEISLTDVSHYFDNDPTKVVGSLRKDGKKPGAFIADTTTANAQVRSLSAQVRLDSRTKLLNPKFYEAALKGGYEGVREITKRMRYTFGWSTTAGAVDNFVYEDSNETYIADEETSGTG
ncbi:unnamed protein product [Prorocentrum cordatum]|uniref:CobN/magnesium chelatase domain-containing protein n=1 Tax=Prorocentrum cordatum TaxID=2364126 RepID=A0ABN9SRR1_9DINO|nr:unnamed protein product [Polarella glacialis]